jgi:hypothetical protein
MVVPCPVDDLETPASCSPVRIARIEVTPWEVSGILGQGSTGTPRQALTREPSTTTLSG